ncbi:MAG: winged helix-turn-helix domain-containing protein [Thermoplasmatota archaeon]
MSAEATALDVLSDESMLRILHLSSGTPMSLADLSIACGITGAACYRRISDLKRLGLLHEVDEEKCREDAPHLYRSEVRKIELQFRDGHIYTVIEGGGGKLENTCLDPISGVSLPWNGADDSHSTVHSFMDPVSSFF